MGLRVGEMRRRLAPAVLVICALLAGGACTHRRSATLDRALAVFGERRFDEALPLFEQAVMESPRDATARWQLQYLPPRAVLLTQGDMDTYPSAMLQAAGGVRTDVAIVNLSLLDWPDYALAVARRAGLPLPEGIDAPKVRRDHSFHDGREPAGVSARVVSLWVESAKRGRLARPLALAASVADLEPAPALRDRLTLAGPYYEVTRDSRAAADDLARLRDKRLGPRARRVRGPLGEPARSQSDPHLRDPRPGRQPAGRGLALGPGRAGRQPPARRARRPRQARLPHDRTRP